MKKILRGVTSYHDFNHPYPVTMLGEIRVIYRQNGRTVLIKDWKKDRPGSGIKASDGRVTVRINEAESLKFMDSATVKIQIQIRDVEGEIIKSDIMTAVTDEFIGG